MKGGKKSSYPERHGKSWSYEEQDQLIDETVQRKTLAQIAEIHSRSETAIHIKQQRLGLRDYETDEIWEGLFDLDIEMLRKRENANLAHVYIFKLAHFENYKLGISSSVISRMFTVTRHGLPQFDLDKCLVTLPMEKKEALEIERRVKSQITRGKEFCAYLQNDYHYKTAYFSAPSEWFPPREYEKVVKLIAQNDNRDLLSFKDALCVDQILTGVGTITGARQRLFWLNWIKDEREPWTPETRHKWTVSGPLP